MIKNPTRLILENTRQKIQDDLDMMVDGLELGTTVRESIRRVINRRIDEARNQIEESR